MRIAQVKRMNKVSAGFRWGTNKTLAYNAFTIHRSGTGGYPAEPEVLIFFQAAPLYFTRYDYREGIIRPLAEQSDNSDSGTD
jgi:hypothetical protein